MIPAMLSRRLAVSGLLLLGLAVSEPARAADCRDPRVYGRGIEDIGRCRAARAWTWLSFFTEDSDLPDEDLRTFVCLEGLRGADSGVRRDLDAHCRDYGARELAPLAADPARAVDKVGDLVASFAWAVQPGGQVSRDIWGEGGVLGAFMDARSFAEFRRSREAETWKKVLEDEVEQVPTVEGTPESSAFAEKDGGTWRWRHARILKFLRVERDQPVLGAKDLPPARIREMAARVRIVMEGRFDPVWAGDANPLGVVVEKFEEITLPAAPAAGGRK